MKKIFIPILVLPMLFLAGCTNDAPEPAPTESYGNVINEQVSPEDQTKYPTYNPISHDAERWQQYSEKGATLPEDDPKTRDLTPEQFAEYTEVKDTMRVQGEVTADTEATAANITSWLESNPEATPEEAPADLIVNRYPSLVGVQYSIMADQLNYEVYMTALSGNSVGGYAQTTLK